MTPHADDRHAPGDVDAENLVKPWSTRPDLHDLVVKSLGPEMTMATFNNAGLPAGTDVRWCTNIVGEFRCPNVECRNVWTTGMVATLIRIYWDNSYNARIYHQRCAQCLRLVEVKVDVDIYVERIARRLRIMRELPVEGAEPSPPDDPAGPHRAELCEGCREGCCPWIKEHRRRSPGRRIVFAPED